MSEKKRSFNLTKFSKTPSCEGRLVDGSGAACALGAAALAMGAPEKVLREEGSFPYSKAFRKFLGLSIEDMRRVYLLNDMGIEEVPIKPVTESPEPDIARALVLRLLKGRVVFTHPVKTDENL